MQSTTETLQSIHDSVWIAPGVQLYGRVEIGEDSSVWPNAVIRCEANRVRIGRMTNIQDFVMIHVGDDHATEIGDFCSITHHATVHGATIGDHCLIGIHATLMDGAVIGAGSIVGGGALVPEGAEFPAHSIIVGTPARRVTERDCARSNRLNAWNYHRNAEHYRRGEHRAWDGPEYQKWLAKMKTLVDADQDLR
jgi:carbonic anhydrase/acetyltransferase-like protein (isoleucine patch superfamily)